jgi:hypothetical protein
METLGLQKLGLIGEISLDSVGIAGLMPASPPASDDVDQYEPSGWSRKLSGIRKDGLGKAGFIQGDEDGGHEVLLSVTWHPVLDSSGGETTSGTRSRCLCDEACYCGGRPPPMVGGLKRDERPSMAPS